MTIPSQCLVSEKSAPVKSASARMVPDKSFWERRRFFFKNAAKVTLILLNFQVAAVANLIGFRSKSREDSSSSGVPPSGRSQDFGFFHPSSGLSGSTKN